MKLLLTFCILIANVTFTLPSIADEQQIEPAETNIEGMSLNDGQKWQMDDHTRQAFIKMADEFLGEDILALKSDALKTQGLSLQSNLNELIKGCTMEGAPHDQLHIFLMEYMPEVSNLTETGSQKSAEKIQHYLRNYDEYFE